jgi:hypothetical protein
MRWHIAPSHSAPRRVSLVFYRGDAMRTPARGCRAIQVLHSRLRRSFRMTFCCAAILRGVAFLARGGSARIPAQARPHRGGAETRRKAHIGTQPGAPPPPSSARAAQTGGPGGCPHESVRRKLLFVNDTEGCDGFVKMAGFRLLHRTTS